MPFLDHMCSIRVQPPLTWYYATIWSNSRGHHVFKDIRKPHIGHMHLERGVCKEPFREGKGYVLWWGPVYMYVANLETSKLHHGKRFGRIKAHKCTAPRKLAPVICNIVLIT